MEVISVLTKDVTFEKDLESVRKGKSIPEKETAQTPHTGFEVMLKV